MPADPTLAPPVAPRVPTRLERHGHVRTDDYYWLRDRDDPRVLGYLEAQNAHADAATAHLAGLRERLYQEMRGRIREADAEPPVPRDGWLYYRRTEEGRQYPVYCRRRGSVVAPEEVLLDLNALAAEHAYLRLYAIEPSPDHRLLAYALDTSGHEDLSLRVKDLDTGELLPDRVERAAFGLEWANDNRTLLYGVQDETKRLHGVRRHRLGDDATADPFVYREDDETLSVEVSKTDSGRFLLLNVEGKLTSEVRVLDADRPEVEPWVFSPRRRGVRYRLEHHGERFLVLTNEDAVNFRLMEAPLSDPARASWREVVAHDERVNLVGLSVFERHLVLHGREGGLTRLWVRDLATGATRRVEFPERVYAVRPGENRTFAGRAFRLHYTSLVTPETVYDLDLDTLGLTLLKRTEVLGGYDPAQYETRQVLAAARDGERIPLSLVHRRGALDAGPAPALLYGYGSYGASVEPAFDPSRLSLLDRGVVFAIAHVRGGGEMGRPWYEAGKLLRKKNSFTDFIDCAEHLVREGVTTPERLAIGGRSAGGLLVGAVLNLRPDLFRAAVAGVPFTDVVTTMLDPGIPLTTGEWDEWGDPRDPAYYEYLRSYSPQDNVVPRAYPWILVTTGLNDPRVAYWEPAKWVAKLCATRTNRNPLLLRTDLGAGHGGPSGRFDALREKAFETAFVLDALGLASG